jgi:hypothetical protein
VRYLAHPACNRSLTCLASEGREGYGIVNAKGVGFSNFNTLARSSALDRTLRSATAFLSGVFPLQAVPRAPLGMSPQVDVVLAQVRACMHACVGLTQGVVSHYNGVPAFATSGVACRCLWA